MIKQFKKILVLFLFFSTFQLVYSQDDIPGCTIEQAFNYNPNATIDDGSCAPDNKS